MEKYFLVIVSGIILVAIDFVYLNLIKSYFYKQIYLVQGENPKINVLGVVLCYIFLVFGLNYFILLNNKKSVFDAFLLGIIIYGVYETTNYSLFKNWDFLTVTIDTLWGGILFALTTFIITKYFT